MAVAKNADNITIVLSERYDKKGEEKNNGVFFRIN